MEDNQKKYDLMQNGISIPSPEEGWKEMQQKLDAEMPEDKKMPVFLFWLASNRFRISALLIIMVLIVTGSIIWNVFNKEEKPADHVLLEKSESGNNGQKKEELKQADLQENTLNTSSIPDDKTTVGNEAVKNTGGYQNKSDYRSIPGKRISGTKPLKFIADKTTLERKPSVEHQIQPVNKLLKSTDSSVTGNIVTEENQPGITDKKTESAVGALSDSASADESAKEAERLPFHFQAGLQWQLSVPTGKTNHYFAGPGAATQPWRILLPGVWLSLQVKKSKFSAEVYPFAGTVLKSSVYTMVDLMQDSVTSVSESYNLDKIFGLSVGASYDYNFSGNWWVGGGFQGYWWNKAVVTINSTQFKRDFPGAPTGTKTEWKSGSRMPDNHRKYVAGFQLFANTQIVYQTKNWQAGFRLGLTFIPLAEDKGPKNYVQPSVFFRLPLVNKSWE